jgi:hypothetical protein
MKKILMIVVLMILVVGMISTVSATTTDSTGAVTAVKATPLTPDQNNAVKILIPVVLAALWGLFKWSQNTTFFRIVSRGLLMLWDIWCTTNNKTAEANKPLDASTFAMRKQMSTTTAESDLPPKTVTVLNKVFGSIGSALEYAGNTLGKGLSIYQTIKGLKK